ncbi:hypothetical protein PtB15_6B50 [Puccinia triticina]|nr:hypothetical protein PtB15_6B50 [Puccinia triticina]
MGSWMTVREVLGHLSDEPLDRVRATKLWRRKLRSDLSRPSGMVYGRIERAFPAPAGQKQLNSNNNGLHRDDNNDELDRDGYQGILTGWTETETKEAGGLPMTMTSQLLSADLVIGSSALLSGLFMSYNCGLTKAMVLLNLMPHCRRLNILLNVVRKPIEAI